MKTPVPQRLRRCQKRHVMIYVSDVMLNVTGVTIM